MPLIKDFIQFLQATFPPCTDLVSSRRASTALWLGRRRCQLPWHMQEDITTPTVHQGSYYTRLIRYIMGRVLQVFDVPHADHQVGIESRRQTLNAHHTTAGEHRFAARTIVKLDTTGTRWHLPGQVTISPVSISLAVLPTPIPRRFSDNAALSFPTD
jgi:hypothetical protein